MFAVEFETTVKDGTIEIPVEHREKFPEGVRVILLANDEFTNEPDDESSDMIAKLLANPIRIPNFQPLSRDEANARR